MLNVSSREKGPHGIRVIGFYLGLQSKLSRYHRRIRCTANSCTLNNYNISYIVWSLQIPRACI